MLTVVEINSKDDLVKHLLSLNYSFSNTSIAVKQYGYDERIAWDTYIVTDKNGVIGFTNGRIK